MPELRIYPDPILRDKALLVKDFDSEKLSYAIKLMQNILKEQEAVGIAAPQIGILEQIVVAYVEEEILALINPRVVEYKGEDTLEEGCLSLPGVEFEIKRPNFVVVGGFDEQGKEKTIEATNLLARVFQHEIDHLKGVLIIDKLNPTERIKFDMQWERGEYEKKHPSKIL